MMWGGMLYSVEGKWHERAPVDFIVGSCFVDELLVPPCQWKFTHWQDAAIAVGRQAIALARTSPHDSHYKSKHLDQ